MKPGAVRRALMWALVIGGIAFAVGFFGPLAWAPDANQGPLLGIFYTGPFGFVGGFMFGLLLEALGYAATPRTVFMRSGLWPINWRLIARAAAAVGGVVMLISGVAALPHDRGRGASASIVVGVMLVWYSLAGRMPRWFRR